MNGADVAGILAGALRGAGVEAWPQAISPSLCEEPVCVSPVAWERECGLDCGEARVRVDARVLCCGLTRERAAKSAHSVLAAMEQVRWSEACASTGFRAVSVSARMGEAEAVAGTHVQAVDVTMRIAGAL